MTASISESSSASGPSVPAIAATGPYVGIDVAKGKLDLAQTDSKSLLTVDNDSKGIARIVRHLQEIKPALIVLEATGGLERPLLDALLDTGLPVALVNPRNARYFAKSMGNKAKTDKIDAFGLAEFARRCTHRLAERRSVNQTELTALVNCRRQLTHVRTEQTNRRGTTVSKPAIKAIDKVLTAINKQIDSLNAQIRKLIESDDDFNSIDKILRSVPGVGPVLSSSLIAELSELGSDDHRSVCALVGVAPFNNDSGKFKGKRSIRGGRVSVRSNLYMATVCATRFNPLIKAFYERLVEAGKEKKVAITACMRKLIVLLNAMVREKLFWHQLNQVKALEI